MTHGKLYGIGVGPGDPELITIKGAKVISQCSHIFVPKSRKLSESIALKIADSYIDDTATVHQLIFPMTTDTAELEQKWNASAAEVLKILETGSDACFLTLGDPLLYSTYAYLLRSLKVLAPKIEIETIPGIMALNAAASLTDFPLGEGKEPVTIIPTADDLTAVKDALNAGGTIVLMKVGKRLQDILDLLEETGCLDTAVFVSRAGQKDQSIETDLRKLKNAGDKAGYMSIILVHAKKEAK